MLLNRSLRGLHDDNSSCVEVVGKHVSFKVLKRSFSIVLQEGLKVQVPECSC